MKKIVLMLMAAIPAVVFGQVKDNFTVASKIGTYTTPARAYLVYQALGKDVIDSVNIVNGEFKFHGNILEPGSAYIIIDQNAVGLGQLKKIGKRVDALELFLEKGDITITSADSAYKAQIAGSKINDDSKRLKDQIKPITAKAQVINDEYKAAPEAQQINPAFQDAMQARFKVIQTEQTDVLKNFILANPQSYVSLVALSSLNSSGMDITEIEKLFNTLAVSIKQTETGKTLAEGIAALKTTAIGSQAPEFTQADTSGNPVALSSFRGKYVLLDFWASWCLPCRQDNPHIVRVYDHYKSKNFTIVGISLDKAEEKASWLKAIHDDGLKWTQLSDLKFWINDVAILYKISFVPQNYLIDPTGKIIAKNLKGEDLDAKLAEIFKM